MAWMAWNEPGKDGKKDQDPWQMTVKRKSKAHQI